MEFTSRSSDGLIGSVKGAGYSGQEIQADYQVSSDGSGHLLFELGSNLSSPLEAEPDSLDPLEAIVSCNEDGDCIGKMITVDIRLSGMENVTSLARSHYGPLVFSQDLSEISFYLPTPWVYGKDLDNFIFGDVEDISYFSLGSSSSIHLPVIMGVHTSEIWYMMYLETDQPGSQTLTTGSGSQPIITWKFMGGNVKVHFFTANTPQNLLNKFNSYIYKDFSMIKPDLAGPQSTMWRYGLHLCRKVGDPSQFIKDMEGMRDSELPFDSDCIDEEVMKTSFILENKYNLSAAMGAHIVLPLPVQILEEETTVPCIQTDNTTGSCVIGIFNMENVTYPDIYDPTYGEWFSNSYQNIVDFPKENLYIHDIAPTDESTPDCLGPSYVPKGVDESNLPCLTSWVASKSTEMYNVHTDYARDILAQVDSIDGVKTIRSDVAMVGLPHSTTFTGSKVEATWQGMQRSLREVLLLGMMGLPFTSMPVCGTHYGNTTNSELLCLRWLQLACYMPGLHSWYEKKDTSRLLYNIPKSYQRYVRWALEDRYKLIPYLRTQDREWYSSFLPLVRPMVLQYPDPLYINLWTQFMFGSDILVAPVLDDQSELVQVRFPPGTWYTMGGGNRVNLPTQGANISIRSKPYKIPAFIRGGATLVLYETAGTSVEETEESSSFSVTVALDCAPDPRKLIDTKLSVCRSNGTSYLNTELNQLHVVTTAVQKTGNIKLTLDGDLDLDADLNTIHSFFLLGLEKLGDVLTVTLPGGLSINATDSLSDTDLTGEAAVYNNDQQTLLLRNLNLEAKDYTSSSITWKFY